MKTKQNEHLRIILAITAKDVVEGIKNKGIISVIFTAIFLVVFYRGLPLLTAQSRPPVLAIFEGNESQFTQSLETNPNIETRIFQTQTDLERYLGGETTPVLGVSFPEGFDNDLENNDQITLEGYAPHWLSDSAVETLQFDTETFLEETAGKSVSLEIESDTVLTHTGGGLAFNASLGIIVVLFLFGLSITPTLMLEEKQAQTIDVLMVSPASSTHLVIGKALTGLLYCLIGAAFVLIFNGPIFEHWGIVITAVILGALFHVAIGLLAGSLINNKQQLGTWTLILAQPLLLPVALIFLGGLFPDWAQTVMAWIPTVALANAIKASLLASPIFIDFGPSLIYVSAFTLALFGAVVLVLRNRDRV